MPSRYLTTARTVASQYEKNEVNEFNHLARPAAANRRNELNEENPADGLTSLNSFNSYQPLHTHSKKVAILAQQEFESTELWRQSILAGIRYANEGRVAPAVIQEDIEVWRELAAHHGWPPAPNDFCGYEENELNEFNELKGAA